MAACIVIIEDEPGILELLRDILEVYSLEAVSLDHPDKVDSLASDLHPDLFLIDLMLPKRNGIAVAERLRKGRFAHVPRVAMSASTPLLRSAERTGLFDATLPKPFDLPQFLSCVKRFAR